MKSTQRVGLRVPPSWGERMAATSIRCMTGIPFTEPRAVRAQDGHGLLAVFIWFHLFITPNM